MVRLLVEADGGSRGNPGPAGYGAVVRDADTGAVLAEVAGGIGTATNNVAEYRGLIAGHADRLANEAMDAAAAGRQWSPGGTESAPRSHAPSTVDDVTGGAGEPVAAAPATGWGTPAGVPVRMLLLRHGETEHSVHRRFSGRNDLPLTDRGTAQAAAAAHRLAGWPGEPIAAVLSSPLARAHASAAAVADRLGVDLVLDEGLTETVFGAWEGHTMAEVRQRWPAEVTAWLASPDAAPPGGESFADTTVRVRRARDRALAGYPGRTVVVVSHVTPIKLLLRLALDASPALLFRLHLDIAGLSVVDWYPAGGAVVRLVNDTSHLAAG